MWAMGASKTNNETVHSIEELVRVVKADFTEWSTETFPWFRGEPADFGETALVPKVYRKTPTARRHNENRLLQMFRMKAPSFSGFKAPRNEDVDQWLFLAQHVGLPTRLLDQTEGLPASAYFALGEEKKREDEKDVIVWMLDPVELNRRSAPEYWEQFKRRLTFDDNDFPLTWFSPEKAYTRREDLGRLADVLADRDAEPEKFAAARDSALALGRPYPSLLNIRAAWELSAEGAIKVALDLPIAIHPTNVHVRIGSQKGCFTVHGKDKRGLCSFVDDRVVKKYVVPAHKLPEFILPAIDATAFIGSATKTAVGFGTHPEAAGRRTDSNMRALLELSLVIPAFFPDPTKPKLEH